MNTRVVTAHLPIELAEKLDEFATHMDRPRGWIVKQAVEDWVALEERRHQMILEGLADIDAGRTVPHSEVMAWVDSLSAETTKAK